MAIKSRRPQAAKRELPKRVLRVLEMRRSGVTTRYDVRRAARPTERRRALAEQGV